MRGERRFVVVWFSHWLTDLLVRFEERPACVIEERALGAYLVAVNAAAQKAGLYLGQRLTEAEALVPALITRPMDQAQCRRQLHKMVRWANRFTPWVGHDPAAYGLILDISGCAHLFGGERALLNHMLGQLQQHGISARAACAGTIGGAWALAHYARVTPVILPQGQEGEALMSLPVAALRIAAPTQKLCRQFGLDHVSDLLCQPRAALVQRLGAELIERLDQAMGHRPETLDPLRPPSRFWIVHMPVMPICERAALMHVLPQLVGKLMADLKRAGRGARRVEMRLWRTDHAMMSVCISLSQAVQLETHIMRVLSERLERVQLHLENDLAVERVDLLAVQTAPMAVVQSRLLQSTAPVWRHSLPRPLSRSLPRSFAQSAQLAGLCDRLAARLGRPVVRPLLQGRYMPEKAVRFIPAYSESSAQKPTQAIKEQENDLEAALRQGWLGARPITLLPQAEQIDVISEIPEGAPRRFRWRRHLYEVAIVAGPERLSAEWWITAPRKNTALPDGGHGMTDAPNKNTSLNDETPRTDWAALTQGQRTRDYFRLEDVNGHRFWLYRDGLYARECTMPRWYMHGFFA